jgi:hypothetical protein
LIVELAGIHPVTAPDARASQAPDRLRRLCGEIVGSVFYGTLLKSVRESPLKGAYGHGGRGEEVFSAQLHGLLAERAGAARADGLADALHMHLRAQSQRLHPDQPSPAQEIRNG